MLLVFIVQGCQQRENDTLESPSNIRLEGEYIHWNAVDDADKYTLKIDELVVEVSDTKFSIFNFQNGEYAVQIQAHALDSSSLFSNTVWININRLYEHPKVVNVNTTTLEWETLEKAIGYRVYVNDIQSNLQGEPYFDLSHLPLDALFDLRVVAVYSQGESLPSKTLYYHTYFSAIATFTMKANINIMQPSVFRLPKSSTLVRVLHAGTLISNEQVHIEDGVLTINYDLTQKFGVGIHTLDLITDEGLTHFKLEVVDDKKPVMTSSSKVDYLNEDLTFSFVLFEGSFGTVFGNSITANDYHFNVEESELTISSAYIDRILADSPGRSSIILSYNLIYNDASIIGIIFITIIQ